MVPNSCSSFYDCCCYPRVLLLQSQSLHIINRCLLPKVQGHNRKRNTKRSDFFTSVNFLVLFPSLYCLQVYRQCTPEKLSYNRLSILPATKSWIYSNSNPIIAQSVISHLNIPPIPSCLKIKSRKKLKHYIRIGLDGRRMENKKSILI